ncbi:MAG: DUF2206 domain-containing protein [Solirubrobacteraceae bacterium]
MGAIALNNGHSGDLALGTLIAIAAAFAFVLVGPRLPAAAYPISLWLLSLALLLSLSLRGDAISGHDILTEFRVFQVTQQADHWSVNVQPSAYNACLSITILPVVIKDLLFVSDVAVFQVVAQAVFALVPVAVYLISRHWLSHRLAFAAAVIFIAQAPFLDDFPFIVRQEVALGFLSALLLLLLVWHRSDRPPRLLVPTLLLGLGLVLSHYSTTYVAIVFFAIALLIDLARRGSSRRSRLAGLVSRSRWIPGPESLSMPRPQLFRDAPPYALVVGFLLVVTVAWNVGLTHSAGNLHGFLSDVGVPRPPSLALLVAGHASTAPTAREYVDQLVRSEPTGLGSRYPPSTYAGYVAGISVMLSTAPRLPLHVASIVYAAGTVVRDLTKVMLLAGVLWLLAFRRRLNMGPAHSAALMVGALIAFAASLLLPAVAVQYNPTRVYQECLVVLSAAPILGALVVARALRIPRSETVIGLFVAAFFFVSSAALPQLVGSGGAYMQLNNFGPYYDIYYTHDQELAAIKWLAEHGQRDVPTFADWFATKKLTAFGARELDIVDNVVPNTITRRSYVFQSYSNTATGAAFTLFNGAILPYRFPASFVHSVKSVVFSTGSVQVLR